MPPPALPRASEHDQLFLGAVRSLKETSVKIEEYRRELLDPQGLLAQQTQKIATIVDKNYELIHHEVVSIGKQLDALGQRVKVTEDRLESGVERFERTERDIAALNTKFEQLRVTFEAFKEQIAQQFAKLTTRENVSAEPATASG